MTASPRADVIQSALVRSCMEGHMHARVRRVFHRRLTMGGIASQAARLTQTVAQMQPALLEYARAPPVTTPQRQPGHHASQHCQTVSPVVKVANVCSCSDLDSL